MASDIQAELVLVLREHFPNATEEEIKDSAHTLFLFKGASTTIHKAFKLDTERGNVEKFFNLMTNARRIYCDLEVSSRKLITEHANHNFSQLTETNPFKYEKKLGQSKKQKLTFGDAYWMIAVSLDGSPEDASEYYKFDGIRRKVRKDIKPEIDIKHGSFPNTLESHDIVGRCRGIWIKQTGEDIPKATRDIGKFADFLQSVFDALKFKRSARVALNGYQEYINSKNT